jgi:hypothetical protein
MKAKVSTLSLDVAELGALLKRIQPVISAEDHARLTAVVSTLLEVTRLSRERGATIARLRRMLGQTSSEKTANVVDAKGPAASTADPASTTSGQEQPDAAPADEATPKPPANGAGGPATTGDKPRRKGHGRIAGSAY